MKNLFSRAFLTLLAVLSVVAVSYAAFNQPKPFLPGPRLIDGTALNTAVTADVVTSENAITAHAGGGGTSAYQLHAVLSLITTAASANDSVKLPKAVLGASVTIDNDSANQIAVYPFGTDQIEDSTSPVTILSGNDVTFVSPTAGKWYTLGSGNVAFGSGVNQVLLQGGATGVDPIITVGGASADTNIGLLLAGKGTGPLHLGGTDKTNGSVRIPTVTSAVNAIDLEGAATLGIPFITVGGLSSDTNAAVALYGKGTGNVLIGGVTTSLAGVQVAQTASAVNDLLVTNGATGTSVVLSASTAGADTNAGIAITPKGSGVVTVGGTKATCSGTTTATCQGQRFVASVTGLTTAASTLAATMTVTDASVVSSSSIVVCQTQGYAGTGIPVVVNVTPGTGSVAFGIQNVSTGAALNATVAVGCFVFGT